MHTVLSISTGNIDLEVVSMIEIDHSLRRFFMNINPKQFANLLLNLK